jgi:adenylate cyclase
MSRTRRLAAILAADVAGYSRLVGAGEAGTLQAFKAIRTELLDPKIAEHNGRRSRRRVTASSSSSTVLLMRFTAPSRCSANWSSAMRTYPRISASTSGSVLTVGDVVVEDGDIFRDGVNVAVRLEGLAEARLRPGQLDPLSSSPHCWLQSRPRRRRSLRL